MFDDACATPGRGVSLYNEFYSCVTPRERVVVFEFSASPCGRAPRVPSLASCLTHYAAHARDAARHYAALRVCMPLYAVFAPWRFGWDGGPEVCNEHTRASHTRRYMVRCAGVTYCSCAALDGARPCICNARGGRPC